SHGAVAVEVLTRWTGHRHGVAVGIGCAARRARGDGDTPGERGAGDREAGLSRAAGGDGDGLRVRFADGAVTRHAVELHRVIARRNARVGHVIARPDAPALAAIHGARVTTRRVGARGRRTD